jgi:hypothetical protein
MTTKHTPGPWIALTAPNGHTYIEARGTVEIARMGSDNMLATGSAAANARLVAAAPDMALALHRIATITNRDGFAIDMHNNEMRGIALTALKFLETAK